MTEFLFKKLSQLNAGFLVLILIAIISSLVIGSLPTITNFGFTFFTSHHWNPVSSLFGAAVPIFGTILTSVLSLIIAIPLSVGTAIFLTELCPRWLEPILSMAIEMLAAIPSIIYGMWGLFVFAPFFAKTLEPQINNSLGQLPYIGILFQGPPLGIGLLTASFVLAIMIVPLITSVVRDVFEVVPKNLKESAYGLGANTSEVVRNIVIPHTKTGVFGAVLLGLGRALGETMAVTFVIGNSHEFSSSLLNPSTTISATLANEFTEAVGTLYTSSLIELALILFLITVLVLAFAELLLNKIKITKGRL